MTLNTYIGINIQFPISQQILNGRKKIETRTYPIPVEYLGKTLLLVETPGKSGNFKSRIVAKFKIEKCFQYKSKKAFYEDEKLHLVSQNSPWAWKDKPKWGWEISFVEVLERPIPVGKIGIRYTRNLII